MTEAVQSLSKLKYFKLALWGPIGVAIAFAVYIIFTSSLEGALGFQGLNNFIVIFKVPIGIAAISFPLVALVTANHRSIQSKKQIENSQIQILEAEQQNRFSNYFKHLEEFEKHLKDFKYIDENKLHIESIRMLHGSLFHTFKNFDYDFSTSLKDKFFDTSNEIYRELYQIRNNRFYLTQEKLINLIGKVNWLNKVFYLSKYGDYETGTHKVVNEVSYYLPKTYKELFSLIKNRMLVIGEILEFSFTERLPDYIKALQEVELHWTDESNILFDEDKNMEAKPLDLFLPDCGEDGSWEPKPEHGGLFGRLTQVASQEFKEND